MNEFDALLKSIGMSRQQLKEIVVQNARSTKRVRNAEGDVLDATLDPVTDLVDDVVDAPAVGETVLVQPAAPVEGEVIEILPDEEDEILEEDIIEEEPVTNVRQYRRVKNARIVRNKDGKQDVVVPVEKVQNVRRYTSRSVTNKGGTRHVPVVSQRDYANIMNKAKKYDALMLNESIDQQIEKAIGDALKKQISNARGTANCGKDVTDKLEKPVENKVGFPKQVKNSRFKRYKNFRQVKNADGSVEIIIDTADVGGEIEAPYSEIEACTAITEAVPMEVTAPPVTQTDEAPVELAPVSELSATDPIGPDLGKVTEVEIVANGRVVSTTNYRQAAVHNAMSPQQFWQGAVYNNTVPNGYASTAVFNDASVLSIPSTFPVKESK